MSWQPIETAPMNGTEIMLYDHGQIDWGSWEFIEVSDWDGKHVYGWKSDMGYIEEPSHWMPALPRPQVTA